MIIGVDMASNTYVATGLPKKYGFDTLVPHLSETCQRDALGIAYNFSHRDILRTTPKGLVLVAPSKHAGFEIGAHLRGPFLRNTTVTQKLVLFMGLRKM